MKYGCLGWCVAVKGGKNGRIYFCVMGHLVLDGRVQVRIVMQDAN